MGAIAEVAEAAEALAGLLARSRRAVALTGAGASAASGVPTYRGAGGSWSRYDPSRYASIDSFRLDPSYYWRFFLDERYPALASAGPSAVHFALAALERAGRLAALVTQNIDGLHQAGGSRRVLELHGNSRRFSCEACGVSLDLEAVHELALGSVPPRCAGCGEQALRPAVVLFGEGLPADVLAEAGAEMDRADLVLVVGSSLVVHPAAGLPLRGLRAGAPLAILNIDPTPLDELATLVVGAPADQVLPLALERAAIPH